MKSKTGAGLNSNIIPGMRQLPQKDKRRESVGPVDQDFTCKPDALCLLFKTYMWINAIHCFRGTHNMMESPCPSRA